jgi:hypothetical protein
MKSIFLFLFLVSFSLSAFSQENVTTSSTNSNLSKLNSKSSLTGSSSSNSLSLKKLGDKNAYKVSDFRFNITPYAWFSSVSGKVGVGNIPPPYPNSFYFNQSWSSALKNLKMAAMLAGNFRYKQVSLDYDFMYLNMKRFNATRENGYGILSANTSMQEFLLDAAISYYFPMKSKSIFLNAYGGMRMWDLQGEATVIDSSTSQSKMFSATQTYVVPIIGINSEFNIDPKWYCYFKGDVGGFGVASQFELNFIGGLGYRFSRNWNGTFGYRGLGVDYHKTANVWDIYQYGFFIGIGYNYL